jgi:hypothetical protein
MCALRDCPRLALGHRDEGVDGYSSERGEDEPKGDQTTT